VRAMTIIFVGVLLAYPVAANLLLALGGVQKMFEGTDQVKVDFRRAWSFWPGHVHVEGIRLTMQDRNVEFSLEMAHADVELQLRELVHRTLHATKVRGDGIVCRFRHRIAPESADAPWVVALPPIFEFEDPPLRLPDAPTAPLDEAHYNLWTVHMDDVDVHLKELWAQMFRYEGDGRVRGAFRLRPAKRLWVGPAELTLMGGKLSTGPDEVLHGIEGNLTVKVDDFDTEPVHGMEPFQFIFARLKVQGQVSSLDAVNFLGGPSASFQLEDGSGVVDMDMAVDHGRFTPESRFSYRTDHVGVETSATKFHVDGELGVSATGPAGKAGGELVLKVPRGSVGLDKSAHKPLQLRGLEASLASTVADVMQAETWAMAGGHAQIAEATLANLAWLNDLPLGKKAWAVEGGRGRASGRVTLSPNDDVEGSVDATVEDAKGSAGKLRWQGSADAATTVRWTAQNEGSVRGRIAARPFKVSNGDRASSETTRAEIDGELSFSDRGGVHGELRAKTGKLKGDLDDRRLAVSSLTGNVRFTGQDARGTVELHDMRASSNDMSSTTPLAKIDGTFSFPVKKGTAGQLRGTTSQWTADFGDSRVEGSSAAGNLIFTSERILGTLLATNVKASSLGSCPFTEMKSVSVAGDLRTPEGAPATGALRGSLDGLALRWGEFTAAANRMVFSGTWDGTTVAARLDSTKIRLKNGVGAPKSWQAVATATSIQTSLALVDGEARGPVRIDVQKIVGQVGKTQIGGDVVASLNLLSKDPSHRTADVTGVVQARNVDLSSQQHHTDDWWAEFKIDSAHVDTRQNFDLAGKVRASFRDGLPALNVLASEDEIPAWVPTFLPLKRIALDLSVERFCKWSDVQILDASGGPLSAKGRLQFEPGETRGAILLRLASLGFVSVGLDFVEDYSNSSPLVGATWLEEHLLPMTKAATDKHDAVCRPEPPQCQ
jgi:hypothetical protein